MIALLTHSTWAQNKFIGYILNRGGTHKKQGESPPSRLDKAPSSKQVKAPPLSETRNREDEDDDCSVQITKSNKRRISVIESQGEAEFDE